MNRSSNSKSNFSSQDLIDLPHVEATALRSGPFIGFNNSGSVSFLTSVSESGASEGSVEDGN